MDEKLETTQQTQPEQAVEQSTPPVKSSNFLIILLSILLVLALSSTAYFAFQTQKLVDELQLMSEGLQQITESTVELTQKPTSDLVTYINTNNVFSFRYPKTWGYVEPYSLIPMIDHKISVDIVGPMGFGYCFKYEEELKIEIDGRNARMSDGVGIGETDLCEAAKAEMSQKGNSFVIIDFADNQHVLINYDYPLKDKKIAKENLDQILSTFKFTN